MTPPRTSAVAPRQFDDQWVSASEVGAHAYCARSHWLQHVQKAPVSATATAARAAGVVAHERQARRAAAASRLQWAGPVLLTLAVLVLAVTLWLVWR